MPTNQEKDDKLRNNHQNIHTYSPTLHAQPGKKVVKVSAFLGESEELKTSKFFDPPSENDWPETELDPANFDTGSKQ